MNSTTVSLSSVKEKVEMESEEKLEELELMQADDDGMVDKREFVLFACPVHGVVVVNLFAPHGCEQCSRQARQVS